MEFHFPLSGFLLLGGFGTGGEGVCPRISYLPVLLPSVGMLSAGSKKRAERRDPLSGFLLLGCSGTGG